MGIFLTPAIPQPETMEVESVVEAFQRSYVLSWMTVEQTRMTKSPSKRNLTTLQDEGVTNIYRYSTFVRIGSGLSFADYVWVRDKPWKVWDPKHPPHFLQTAKRGHEDKGDVYLEPEEYVETLRAVNIFH